MISHQLREAPLPGFVPPAALRGAFAESLRPPPGILVSEAAERHVRINAPGAYVGPLRLSRTPYAVEPMNRALRRDCQELIVVGPSQTVKTTIGLCLVAHAVKARAAEILWIAPTRDLALDFAERRVEKGFLDCSPDLAAELGSTRGDDKRLNKSFRNGTMLTLGWAVAGQFSSRPVPIVILDERDRMPADINGEGDARALARNRTTTFKRNGLVVVVSSPSLDFEGGIVGDFHEGDQNLWHWRCLECKEHFTPGFGFDRKFTIDHLYLAPGASPEDAARQVAIVCPHCEVHLEPRWRRTLNEAAFWLPVGQRVTTDGEILGRSPQTHVASYWIHGFFSLDLGLQAHECVAALHKFERAQDEEPLKTWTNTRAGGPYTPRQAGALPLEPAALQANCIDYGLGRVPPGVDFLTAAVDVQIRRFAVMVLGWDREARGWMVDRFDLETLPDGAALDPANVQAHWDVLVGRVLERAYPLADDDAEEMPVASVTVDAGGAAGTDEAGEATEGVSLQARDFARRCFAAGLPSWRINLVRGLPQRGAPMLPSGPKMETDDNGKRRRDGVGVYGIGVHRIKNVIDNRRRLSPPQPGCLRFPRAREVPAGTFEELCAERRIKGRWEKDGPNESWDLAVYNEAGRQRLRVERIDWSMPPAWARPRSRAAAPAPLDLGGPPPAAAGRGRRVRSRLFA